MGFAEERVLKAIRDGIFFTQKHRDTVERGERVGTVSVYGVEEYRKGVPVDASYAVTARISGVVRGLLRTACRSRRGTDRRHRPRGAPTTSITFSGQVAAGRGGRARGAARPGENIPEEETAVIDRTGAQ
jgi:hypothetical protein